MYTVDQTIMDAPVETCFRAGADVEGWPDALPHYRWVKFQRKDAFGTGLIEMAARRHFGPVPYPVWWVSEMHLDEEQPAVIYRHVEGITTGMDVVWSFTPTEDGGTHVKIVHEWVGGPAWPLPMLLRRWIADFIIGPVFINYVASRTLQGIRTKAERILREEGVGS